MTGASSAATAVVFVNYHSEGLIAPRAAELLAAGLPVVVADNSGTYGDGPGVRLPMGGNCGFAHACNLGVAALGEEADVVVLHNPDVRCTPWTLLQLAHIVRWQNRPGIVAPGEQVGNVIRENGYRYPYPFREFGLAARAAVRSRLPPPGGRGGRGRSGGPQHFRGRGRRFAGAGCLAVARRAFAEVGGFDVGYFLYGEDLDLWHRVGVAGFDRAFEPGLVVVHDMGTGSPMGAAAREVLRWLGVELFAERHREFRWRAMRAAHRPFLPTLDQRAGALGATVRALWSRGVLPSEVQGEVRNLFLDDR